MTKQDLIEEAFNKLGIINLPPTDSPQYQFALRKIDTTIRIILCTNKWTFALRTTTLHGFNGQYQLPHDCLQLHRTELTDWQLHARTITSNKPIPGSSHIRITYTTGTPVDTDNIQAPPDILNLITTHLASTIAPIITGSQQDSLLMLERYKTELSEAQYQDAVQYASNAQHLDPLHTRSTHPYHNN